MTLLKYAVSSLGLALTVSSISMPAAANPQSEGQVSRASGLGGSITKLDQTQQQNLNIAARPTTRQDVPQELKLEVNPTSQNSIKSSFQWQSELLFSNGHRRSDINTPILPSEF